MIIGPQNYFHQSLVPNDPRTPEHNWLEHSATQRQQVIENAGRHSIEHICLLFQHIAIWINVIVANVSLLENEQITKHF
jgi:hypothetical protein